MSFTPNREFEKAKNEIEKYKGNYSKLHMLRREHDGLLTKHFDLTENIKNTIGQTLKTLKKAEALVCKHKDQTAARKWKRLFSSRDWEEYEQ
ncbi:hypothetical protein BHE90_002337 [Fusarium euwallaceae]|uniref:Uncharacterized protein n=2 Tax=Fusarium solani species complex TaxID=232080 RepID=A0A430M584_9HYPO|nr:hypothetical protein BHE90_002337 [Fusarium euwallaceae]